MQEDYSKLNHCAVQVLSRHIIIVRSSVKSVADAEVATKSSGTNKRKLFKHWQRNTVTERKSVKNFVSPPTSRTTKAHSDSATR